MNLAEGLAAEIKRVMELRDEYRMIPTGVFGSAVLTQELEVAIDAQASGDVIKMLRAHEALKGCE